MKTIYYQKILETAKNLTKACESLSPSCRAATEKALQNETNNNAAFALETLLKNDDAAKENRLPVCQDTGMAVFFVKLGQDVRIEGGLLTDAINRGAAEGYAENGYRSSLTDPVTREPLKINAPAVIHTEIVDGDKLELDFMPKGFGSENMSKLYMLKPSDGMEKAKDCIVDAVREADANPCPPVVVGVGIGGTAEKAMLIAKEQLLREIGKPCEDENIAALEQELLTRINALGIGAQGFGGSTTAYAVHIAKFPTHISALPVAVNIQCNAVRTAKAVL